MKLYVIVSAQVTNGSTFPAVTFYHDLDTANRDYDSRLAERRGICEDAWSLRLIEHDTGNLEEITSYDTGTTLRYTWS